MTTPGLSIVTTCKGRLSHLRETLPRLAASNAAEVIVVDYDCPDGTHRWVMGNHPNVIAVHVEDRPRFNISDARNIGLRRASQDFVLFIDADILLETQDISGIVNWADGSFWRNAPIKSSDRSEKQLAGTCLVPRAVLAEIGAYDEAYVGYGGEDIDLYERLKAHGLKERHFGEDAFSSIPHDNAMRTSNFALKDISQTLASNRIYMLLKRALKARRIELGVEERTALYHQIFERSYPPLARQVIDVTPEMRVEFRTIRRRLFAGKPSLFDIRIHHISRP